MAKELFKAKNFSAASLELIEHMDRLTTEYLADGMTLTLRQLYYRLVASDTIPNNLESYNRIKRLLGGSRVAGMIDWSGIVDRGRSPIITQTWSGPSALLRAARDSVCYDHWPKQHRRIEVWVEKEALIDVVARACAELRVPHFACKGYVSWSAIKLAAERIARAQNRTTILYLGDHDPSGMNMPSELLGRLRLLGPPGTRLERIALSMDQIDEFGCPPNWAKLSDSRAKKYIAQYGDKSWELDALRPAVLIELIECEVEARIDRDKFDAVVEREDADKAKLAKIADDFAG